MEGGAPCNIRRHTRSNRTSCYVRHGQPSTRASPLTSRPSGRRSPAKSAICWRGRPPTAVTSARSSASWMEEFRFLDDGQSGASLVRPALERLRDLVAMAAIDVVYVHAPDRLARSYAHQAVLIEEFARA